MNLRAQILVGMAVLILAAVSSTGWLVLRDARLRLESGEEERGRLLGDAVARLVRLSYDGTRPLAEPANRAQLEARATQLLERGDVRELVIVEPSGRPVLGDPGGDAGIAGAAVVLVPVVKRLDGELYAYAPLPGATGTLGGMRARLPSDSELVQPLAGAQRLLFGVTLFDGGLVLLFGAMFLRRVIRPLLDLSRAAQKVAAGDLEVPPVAVVGKDEVGRLIEDFNRMTASLRRQRDQMVAQEKLATVGRLSAGVAHEVGNPLAAVIGYAEMLLADEKDAVRRDMLERIRRETERMRAIVSDLLEYARPPSGTPEPVALAEVIEATASLLRPQARFQGVTIERRLPDDLPAAAASASRLVQVLVNLFLNAADAMEGRGAITVSGSKAGELVELTVRDTGPGVAPADRTKIFDPFFTTKEPGRGTGLGLAISRSIVEAYGGTLALADAAPVAGAGAAFVIRLPVWRADSPAGATPSPGR